MEVTHRATDQLTRYLQHVVEFLGCGWAVAGTLEPEHQQMQFHLTHQTARGDHGVTLVLEEGFLRHNQDARVLEVLKERAQHWLIKGLPRTTGARPVQDPITLQQYHSS